MSTKRIIAYKTILENTATNCTFLATELDEKTQNLGPNSAHIIWAGELDVSAKPNALFNATWEFIEWLGDNGWFKLALIQDRMWTKCGFKHYTLREVHNIFVSEKFPA